MNPLLLLGALLGAVIFLPRSRSGATTSSAIVDASERNHANAAAARFQIDHAIRTNSISTIAATATAIETMGMPRTAENLRAWGEMARQGGHAVAGQLGGKRQLPDWLRFQLTASRLSGDPKHIRATAKTLKAYGYRDVAEIHLRQL